MLIHRISWPVLPIFSFFATIRNIEKDMYNTFNMELVW